MNFEFNKRPHRRKNILTGEWILVSPHRTKRPWKGKKEKPQHKEAISYDPKCYLCPGNERAGGGVNPDYKEIYSFKNDYAAILDGPFESTKDGLLEAETETGLCKVICYAPDHSLTLPLMEDHQVLRVVDLWQKEYQELGAMDAINHVQIFENKGEIMGCSNPHPHGQIWAQRSIPLEVQKKHKNQEDYWNKNNKSLLKDYIGLELRKNQRIIFENETFVALVPYWAVWPYESMIVPKKQHQSILTLSNAEKKDFGSIIKMLTIKYDNLFGVSFPYSAGIHQAPTNSMLNEFWHFHMSFYPPLLRSAEVKKFMVGYEMFATPQRDITAEQAAEKLKSCSEIHYSNS
jgi:UDPglucose--hexose-1-phosphate uridylyltransferase